MPVRRTDGPVRLPSRSRVLDEGVRHGRDRHARLRPRGDRPEPRRPAAAPRGQGPRAAGARPFTGRGGGWQACGDQSGRRRGVRVGARRHAGGSGAFEPTRRLDARLDLLPDARPLRQGCARAFSLWHGRGPGTRRAGGAAAGRGLRPRSISSHRRSSPAATASSCRAYSPLATIGGGVVLDPRPPRVSIRSATGAERLRQLDACSLDDDGAVTVFVNEAGGTGLARSALVSRAGLSYRKADAAVARLTKGGAATLIGTMLVSPRACTELERAARWRRSARTTKPIRTPAACRGRKRASGSSAGSRPRSSRRSSTGSSRRAGSSRATGSRSQGQGVSLSAAETRGAGGAGAGLSRRRVDAAGSPRRPRPRPARRCRWPSA